MATSKKVKGGTVGRKPARKTEEALTGKELAFALAYTGEARFNGTKAARLAGYAGADNVLAMTASRLLRKDKVSAFIDARLAEAKMTSDEVLTELATIARAPWKDFVEVEYGGDGEPVKARLKLTDKIKTLELLGKHHRLFDRAGEETPDFSKLSDEEVIQLAAIRAKLNS